MRDHYQKMTDNEYHRNGRLFSYNDKKRALDASEHKENEWLQKLKRVKDKQVEQLPGLPSPPKTPLLKDWQKNGSTKQDRDVWKKEVERREFEMKMIADSVQREENMKRRSKKKEEAWTWEAHHARVIETMTEEEKTMMNNRQDEWNRNSLTIVVSTPPQKIEEIPQDGFMDLDDKALQELLKLIGDEEVDEDRGYDFMKDNFDYLNDIVF